MTIPCGHVICKSCVYAFMMPPSKPNEHDTDPQLHKMRCYVCETDLSDNNSGRPQKDDKSTTNMSSKSQKKKKSKLKPGVIEIKTEGTGFAGSGKNVVKKAGVAFQC